MRILCQVYEWYVIILKCIYLISLLQYQDVILDKIIGGAMTFVADKNFSSILASVLLKYVIIIRFI